MPGLPPTMEFTLQVTAVLLVPVTVAVNGWLPPGGRVAEAGEIVILMVSIVTVAFADFEGSATLVAATENVRASVEEEDGAVYSPLEEIVPTVVLPPAISLTLQVTPWLTAPDTTAV